MTELKRTIHHSVMLDLELIAITQKTAGCLLLERSCVRIAYSCTSQVREAWGSVRMRERVCLGIGLQRYLSLRPG